VITEFVDIFSEDSLNKLLSKRGILHTIEFDLEEVIYYVDEDRDDDFADDHDEEASDNSDDDYGSEDIAHNCIERHLRFTYASTIVPFHPQEKRTKGKEL